MNDQDADPSNGQEIQRQFALLQEEMKRVMAAPPDAPYDPAADPASDPAAADAAGALHRIERGLEDLRRDADRLRTRMAPPTQDQATVAAVAGLSARIDAIAAEVVAGTKAQEDGVAWLRRTWQTNLEALDELGDRMEALARRRKSRWLAPLAILLGAVTIAVAVVASVPGRTQMLIDRSRALLLADKPIAQAVPPPPAPPAAPVKTAEAPAAQPSAPAPPLAPPPPAPAPLTPAPLAPSTPLVMAPPPVPIAPPVTVAEPPPSTAASDPTSPPAAAASAAPVPSGQIVIRAKADAWVEIRNRQGAALIQRVFHAGETWPVPGGTSLLLSTGNAGGVELLVDGAVAPPLGGTGMIRRDVRLDAETVRVGRYAPDPPGRPRPDAPASR